MRSVEKDDLTALLHAFSATRTLTGITRLRGGSKKGVYRLLFDDDSTAVLYSWAPGENFWQAGRQSDAPLSDASGFTPFPPAPARLSALGVGVPRLLLADGTRSLFPADVAIVEDFPGGTLESL